MEYGQQPDRVFPRVPITSMCFKITKGFCRCHPGPGPIRGRLQRSTSEN
jgi:hypothetical protein